MEGPVCIEMATNRVSMESDENDVHDRRVLVMHVVLGAGVQVNVLLD